MSPAPRLERRLSRRIGISELEILLALAKHGSMARAAEDLAVTQPAISRAVAELEKALGVRLLDRDRRGVVLTLYGRSLVRCASVVVDELKQGLRALDFLADMAAGELHIGCPEAHASWLLPAAIERFYANHSQVSVHVTPASTIQEDFTALRERQVDFILGRIPKSRPGDDLTIQELFDEEIFVVVGAQSPWAYRRKVALQDLAAEKWVVTPFANPNTQILVDAFRAHGLGVPRVSVEAASINLRIKLLLSGQFVAMMPNGLLHSMGRKMKALKVLPIDLSAVTSPVAVFTLKSRTPSPMLAPFVDCLRDVAKPLTREGKYWMK